MGKDTEACSLEVFPLVKPVCTLLMKEVCCSKNIQRTPNHIGLLPSGETNITLLTNELINTLEQLPMTGIQGCAEFILLPVFKALPLQAETCLIGQREREVLLEAVNVVVTKSTSSWIRSRPDIFFEIFYRCLETFDNASSDEEKLKAAILLQNIFVDGDEKDNAVKKLVSPELRGNLGYCLKLLLDLCTDEKYRQLRIESMMAIQALIHTIDADTFANFLPGITTGLCNIILSDYKIGTKVQCVAIQTLNHLLLKTLGDTQNKTLFNSFEDISNVSNANSALNYFIQHYECAPKSNNDVEDAMKGVRTKEWAMETGIRIHRIFVVIFDHRRLFSSWMVRRHLVELSSTILSECFNFLRFTVSTKVVKSQGLFGQGTIQSLLLSAIISGTADENKMVRETSMACLQRLVLNFSKLPGNIWRSKVVPSIQYALHDKIRSLPRYARSSNQNALLVALTDCTGHIQLLQQGVRVLVDASPEIIIRSLMSTVDLCSINGKLFHVQVVQDIQFDYPAKSFEHIQDQRTIDSLKKFLKAFGKYYPEIIVQILRDAQIIDERIQESQRNPHAAEIKDVCNLIYIANEILLGIEDFEHADSILDLYLNFCFLQEPAALDYDVNNTIVSLALEGIGNWSQKVSTAEILQRNLVRMLFPTLRYLGDDNISVKRSAMATLTRFSLHGNYKNVADLLRCNIDYIIDSVVERLRTVKLFPSIPLVLIAVIESVDLFGKDDANVGLLPFLNDLVDSLLLSLDNHRNEEECLIHRLLKVSLTILDKVVAPGTIKRRNGTELESLSITSSPLAGLIDELNQWKSEQEEEERLFANCEDSVQSFSNEGELDAEKEIPPMQKMTSSILRHCQHYSMNHSVLVRRKTLDVLQAGFRILNECNEELLPLINLVWPSIISNLKNEQNESVLAACFGTIEVAIDSGGTFMESRFIDDVWDHSYKLLQNLATKMEENATISTFSKELCLAVLACFCTATLKLPRLASELCGKLTKIVVKFRKSQEESLRVEAERLWHQIGEKNPELIWYFNIDAHILTSSPHFLCLSITHHPQLLL